MPYKPLANALRCRHREAMLARLANGTFDAVVVGGGINGASAAAALAASGAAVALLEGADFAAGTSQESSNLAWGGIKYLENREFRLVRNLCRSRNRLMRAFPLAVPELPFLLSHEPSFRHGLTALQAGTYLYWILGERHTARPRRLTRKCLRTEAPVVNADRCDGALEYRDAWFADGDARFTFNLIRRAIAHGATAANYLPCTDATFANGGWRLAAFDRVSETTLTLQTRLLVNACGPWADAFGETAGITSSRHQVFSKGVHLIVPRLDSSRRVLAFFADDGRLFFTIPLGNRTCIGTTDTPVSSPYAAVTDADRQFILDNVNARLQLPTPLTVADVIAERCGVRPLAVDKAPDAAAVDRDWLQLSRGHAVVADADRAAISVYGGKLTDCLNVGEEIVAAAANFGIKNNLSPDWYRPPPPAAPPANLAASVYGRLQRRFQEHAPAIAQRLLAEPATARLARPDADVTLAELLFSIENEFVLTPEDLLRRRSLLALCYPIADCDALIRDIWPRTPA